MKRDQQLFVPILIIVFICQLLCISNYGSDDVWHSVQIKTSPAQGIASWNQKIGSTPVSYGVQVNETSMGFRSKKTIYKKDYHFKNRIAFFGEMKLLK